MNPLLEHLNPPQLAAVTLPAAHALILAGAGSGKTRVLTTRIAWLLSNEHLSPASLLAVTFTNKAAKEMQARLAAMLPFNVKGMWIGTFHGLCNRLLRAHYREAGLPALFQILDVGDQQAAVKRLMKAMEIDDEKYPPREVCQFINAQKEQGLRANAVEAWDNWAKRRVEIYTAYEEQCRREGVVDFAELLLRCYELLERNEPLRMHYQQRFAHIMVDEFQDTNKLQYKWLKLLAGGGGRLFCVGDDDQSIYGFRGADVGNMRDFEREFKVEHLIRLEQNYRSHGNILNAANAIIKNNSARLGKNLWTDAGQGEPIRVHESYSDAEEARWIAEEVRNLAREGYALAEMAVLYRSNAQSRALEHALFSANVAYRVYGGLRFFDRAEIKHALAYLRLIANPHDDTAFSRVLNFPTRGIGARSLEALQDVAKAQTCSLHAAIPQLSGKAAASIGAFARLIEQMRAAAQRPLPELIEHVILLSGLRTHYENDKESKDKLANLDELVNAAINFVGESGEIDASTSDTGELGADLAAFLAHASLEAGEHQAGDGDDALQLMTVHSAKGLEFGAVFVGGMEEGLFPHDNAIAEPQGLEEERRLMYVAVTRARRRLYLSMAQMRMLHGQTRFPLPSRFLDEIPAELLKWLTPRRQGQGGYRRESVPPAPTFAPTLPTPAKKPVDGELRVGQKVLHAKFGQGVVLNSQGSGADARVQVNFGAQGVKWLAVAIAKLEAL